MALLIIDEPTVRRSGSESGRRDSLAVSVRLARANALAVTPVPVTRLGTRRPGGLAGVTRRRTPPTSRRRPSRCHWQCKTVTVTVMVTVPPPGPAALRLRASGRQPGPRPLGRRPGGPAPRGGDAVPVMVPLRLAVAAGALTGPGPGPPGTQAGRPPTRQTGRAVTVTGTGTVTHRRQLQCKRDSELSLLVSLG